MTATIICLFNHKGGVSKTTTTFNLGWALAEKGKKVLLVDADPQCNLTGMALTLSGQEDLEEFYKNNPNSNIYHALNPAFGGAPTRIEAAKPVSTSHPRLQLLAGHIDFATYEPELAMAHRLIEAMPVLQNLPGAAGHLMRETAKRIGADYVLVDMSPSIGAINHNLWLQSDYFIVPTSPDYFCFMAIESLARVLPQWHATGQQLRRMNVNLAYKLPLASPLFIGIISQRYRPRSGKPAQAFQQWIDQILERTQKMLVPALEAQGMTVSTAQFKKAVKGTKLYELAQIADFNSLIAQSQTYATPIFALSDVQLKSAGVILAQQKESRDKFRRAFEGMADSVMQLCKPRV